MIEAPKYSHVEIERRWLVDLSAADPVRTPFREIDEGGTKYMNMAWSGRGRHAG